ncbi:methyltransferase domain-containing protein [Pseudodesulfovibrio cashew]|uniref:Methyltransferase domain-containing protein n=1 Tax=Pseudodesulfovibrio cashew TaxID=2678688 RepID=A0A6I6JEW1_9BACT|nr:methyltransferase [Pseudodesulfovibrio cashew]QGY40701.1 methyltransferase domain-containing protein [Pseudodesulfovibrio cashew]
MNRTLFNDNVTGALEFTVSWEMDGIRHEEWFLGRKVNPVNDIFPRGMREALEGKGEGESVAFTYEPRMCIPRFKESLVRILPLDRLRKKTRFGQPILPRLGRFYPQGHIDGLLDVYPDTLTPFRLTGLTDKSFTADCNHPLATIPVTIEAAIQYLQPRDAGTYGSLTHWREATCDWGPGMQTRHNGEPTDFFHDAFFQIRNENIAPNAPCMDNAAERNLQALQDRVLTPDMRVLAMDAATSPHMAGRYDAVIFTQVFEYLADPVGVLRSIAAHLAPGGMVLAGFGNAYDKDRVIQGWTELHEFERMGLILEYLRRAGLDGDARTFSRRNDWRDQDDPRFLETKGVSDSIYMVCGRKR